MPSGLAALLDDVAAIAKLIAASIDDIGAAASRAGMKAAGVVVDDTAVTPSYVTGFTHDCDLPIIARIDEGQLKTQLLIILPVAHAFSALLTCGWKGVVVGKTVAIHGDSGGWLC